jgi:hypothetical protein
MSEQKHRGWTPGPDSHELYVDAMESKASELAPASCSPPVKPVTIDKMLLHRIGVREWGLPSLCMPGKIWRSEKHGTITCMVAHEDKSKVKIETLPLVVIEGNFEPSWMPDHWRAALWEYVQAWPNSGCDLGPFLALTEEQRCDFIRRRAAELVKSDNIGCRHIAHDIGQFAALQYPLPEVVANDKLTDPAQ